jgi:hypothetical protein
MTQAVVDEPQTAAMDEGLSILVHASSKAGKSTLTSTAPLPILVIDAEGSWRFIRKRGFIGKRLRIKSWNPMLGPPPRWNRTEENPDGDFDVIHVTVRDWALLRKIYDWLTTGQHDFTSVVIDSISEVQRRCKANIAGTAQMQMQQWGDLLSQMDALIRGYRDLNLVPGMSIRCVVFVAETRLSNGKWKPYMQGQIEVSMPYWVDVIGYLYVEDELDPSSAVAGGTKKVRKLLVGPHPQYETGERVQGTLPDVIRQPNIAEMMCTIFGGDCLEEASK